MSTTVLVIDDSLMVREQVSKALAGAGFSIVEAQDGIDALQKLDASPEVKLIVCDVNMPRMNGLQFLERLRKDGGALRLPVVMLTTEGQPELIQRAKALGAKGWIVKPFKPELLVAAAKKLTASP
jgi:two-component system, chemotaxis family, chemotaxis protein CheY